MNGNIFCQRHYAQAFISKLGLNNVNNVTSSYRKPTKPLDEIPPKTEKISEKTAFLKNKFNIDVTEINEKLPNIYWTPKLHKNPTKARLTVAAAKYSVKPVLKAVRVTLKVIQNIETR